MIADDPNNNKDAKDAERLGKPIVTPWGREIYTEAEWDALSEGERQETSWELARKTAARVETMFAPDPETGYVRMRRGSPIDPQAIGRIAAGQFLLMHNQTLALIFGGALKKVEAMNAAIDAPRLFEVGEAPIEEADVFEGVPSPYAACLELRKDDSGHYALMLKAPAEIEGTQAARAALAGLEDRALSGDVSEDSLSAYEAISTLAMLRRLYQLAETVSITPYWEYPYADAEGVSHKSFALLLPSIIAIRGGINELGITVEMAREVMNCGSSNAWDHITTAIDRIDSDYSVARLWAKDEGREQVAEALGNAEETMPRFRALMRAAEGPHGKDLEAEIRKNREKPVQLAVVGRVNEVTHYDGALVGQERLSQALIKIGTGAREVPMEWDAHDADGNTYRTKIRLTATIDAERAYGSIKEPAYKRPAGIANLIYTAQKTIKQARRNADGARVLEIRESSFEDVGSATTSSTDPKNKNFLNHSNRHIAARLNDIQAGLTLISNVHANGTYYAFDKQGHLIRQATLDNVLLLNAFRKSVGFDEGGRPAEGRWVISDDISLLSIPAFAHSIDYPLIDTGESVRKLDPLERVVYTFIIQKIRELEYLYGVSGKRSIKVTADDLANLGADVAQEGLADKEKRQDPHKRRRFLDRIQASCIGSGRLFDEIEHTFEIDYPKTSKVKVRPIYKQGNRRKGKEPKRILDGVKITIEGPKTGLEPPETKALEKGSKG